MALSFVGFGLTDASGDYTIIGLPDGDYVAITQTDDFVDELFDDIRCPELGSCDLAAGTPIAVTLAAPATNIDFTLLPGATISGSVTEAGTAMAAGKAAGDPIPGVFVDFFDVEGNLVGLGLTDASGDYTATGLPPGIFFAVTFNFDGFVDVLYDGIPRPFFSCILTTGTLIPLTVGAKVTGVDFALPLPGSFSGTVTEDGSGEPIAGQDIFAFDALGNFVNFASTDAGGHYTVTGLGPTDYFAVTLDAPFLPEVYDDVPCPLGTTCDPTTGTPIAVGPDMDTPGIDFGLARQGSVTGTVTNASTGAKVANVTIKLFDVHGGFVTSATTGLFGTYLIDPGAAFPAPSRREYRGSARGSHRRRL